MRILHLNYTYDGPVPTAQANAAAAKRSWLAGATDEHYKRIDLQETDFAFNAKILGDPQPHVLLNHFLDKALPHITAPNDSILLTNSDVRLIKGKWETALWRASKTEPNYEPALDHQPKRPGDHDWQPQSFWIPARWWQENSYRCPPIFFPCPWWEPVMYHLIGERNDRPKGQRHCTSHKPHPRARAPQFKKQISFRWNYAVQFGWYKSGFHKPKGIGRLKLHFPNMPKDFQWKSSATPPHSPAARPETP